MEKKELKTSVRCPYCNHYNVVTLGVDHEDLFFDKDEFVDMVLAGDYFNHTCDGCHERFGMSFELKAYKN